MRDPLILAAILFVLWLPCVAGGAFGWRKLRKKYPEVGEFQHLGVASIFTGGLPLFGLMPLLFTQSRHLSADSFLSKWLARPLSVWGAGLALDFGVRILAPEHISNALRHFFTNFFGGVFIYMLIVGWNAPDELVRVSSRKGLQSALWGVLVVGCFYALKSASLWWTLTGFLLLWPTLFFMSSAFVQDVLATLAVGTRHSSANRERVWLPLLLSGAVCMTLSCAAPWLHRVLAHLVGA